MYKNRKVKKLKRQRPRSLMRGPDSGSADLRAYSWAVNGAAVQGRSRRGDRYGLDAHPCLRYRDGGSRAAGAERISGRGKPHPEEPVEWAIEALGRRASHTRQDRPSPGPPSPCRGRDCRAARHHPCLVSQAYRRQVRWLKSLSRSGQTAGYPTSRAADRSYGQREPRLGLWPDCGRFGQSWVHDFRSNGWQYPAPPRAAAGAGAYDHMAGLHSDPLGAAGTDFFTAEVLTLRGRVT